MKNKIARADHPFHNWYRFVLSFPPHLVRTCIEYFQLSGEHVILDPFCGTGTTILEAKLNGIGSVGIEANPFPAFASSVKTDFSINGRALANTAEIIAEAARIEIAKGGELRTLDHDAQRVLIKDSISPVPLHKTLILLEEIKKFRSWPAFKYCILALGAALVNDIGNLRFGPEVGVGWIKDDADVVSIWFAGIEKIVNDLSGIQGKNFPPSKIIRGDARAVGLLIEPGSIDAVITSPPYPNEKDYTRTTRLESVVLGFFLDMQQIRKSKKTFVRSNTRGIYTADQDDRYVAGNEEINRLADEIEARRIELGKTSGFERNYHRVTKLYFGGMKRHLIDLKRVLKPGARLAYVVGDQASYLRVMIRTGHLLADIASGIGYEVERIDLFRTRFASGTRAKLNEEILILRWPE